MEKLLDDKNIVATIGIPAYNGKDFIGQAIESVISQTYKNFEIIISDDNSTDGTEEICKEYENRDERIKYIRQEKNLGGFLNTNFILQQSRGLYITMLAHDDALEKDFLEKTIKYMDENPKCILVSGDFEIIDESGSVIRIDKLEKIRDTKKWEKRIKEFFKYPISKTFFCLYGLARGETLRKVYNEMPYPKKIFKGSEMILLSRLATHGEISSIPQTLRKYRQHSQSAYNIEVKNVNSKNFIEKYVILLINLYRIRLDQIKVLWCSNFSLFKKIDIFLSVYFSYLIEKIEKIFRLIKRIIN